MRVSVEVSDGELSVRGSELGADFPLLLVPKFTGQGYVLRLCERELEFLRSHWLLYSVSHWLCSAQAMIFCEGAANLSCRGASASADAVPEQVGRSSKTVSSGMLEWALFRHQTRLFDLGN